QLFFTLYLFKQSNWYKTSTNNKYIWDTIQLQHLNSLSYTNMWCQSTESPYGKEIQDTNFQNLVASGAIYDWLVEKMDDTVFFSDGLDYDKRRTLIKNLLLRQMYGDCTAYKPIYDFKRGAGKQVTKIKEARNRQLYTGKNKTLWEAFNESFPVVGSLYRFIKHCDYTNLAKVLQRIESFAVIETACMNIAKERPDIPIWPLHDCIVTTVSHIDTVDEILLRSVENMMGIRPHTKIKTWSEYGNDRVIEI